LADQQLQPFPTILPVEHRSAAIFQYLKIKIVFFTAKFFTEQTSHTTDKLANWLHVWLITVWQILVSPQLLQLTNYNVIDFSLTLKKHVLR